MKVLAGFAIGLIVGAMLSYVLTFNKYYEEYSELKTKISVYERYLDRR